MTDEELVQEVREDFSERSRARRNTELKWLLNMNFLAGNQYVTVSPRGEIEREEKTYRWEMREVFNHIASISETRLAKLARVRPQLSVRAATESPEDAATAALSTKILRGALADANFSSVINEAAKWSEVAGTSFYKVSWDSVKNEAAVSALSPFEVYPYSDTVAEIEDQRSILHARAYPVEEIFNIWGEEVSGEELDVYTLQSAPSGKTRLKNAAIVIERYERPTRSSPEGRLTIVAGEKLLHDGPLPYLNGGNEERGYPFSKQCALKMPGAFWGVSVIERLIPIQRAYNAVKNRKYELLNRLTCGVLAVEDGSVDTDDLETDGLQPGKILIYRQGSAPPRELSSLSVPLDFSREEERLLSEFILISGVSDLMRSSKAYSENASGAALQLLVEQDDTRLLVTVDNMRAAVKTAARQTLKLYKQFAGPRQLLAAAGGDETEVAAFARSAVSADDVVFDTENELSDTPAQRKNMVMELLRTGLLADETGVMTNRMRAKVLDAMGFSQFAGEIAGTEETDERD